MRRTKDDIRAFLQDNLRYCGPPLSPDWGLLLSWHPTWGPRQAEVQKVRVRLSRLNASVQLQLSLNGRRFFTISWHACVSAPTAPTLPAAMREAVQRQSLDWKRQQPLPHTCAECGQTQHIQVDHKLQPLKTLIAAFLSQHEAPDAASWLFNGRSHAPRLPDGVFKRQWRIFHKSRADFQFLCRTCNARKGARFENPDTV
jgi:5-methylcytosine-specific restriction endonuclease McrA